MAEISSRYNEELVGNVGNTCYTPASDAIQGHFGPIEVTSDIHPADGSNIEDYYIRVDPTLSEHISLTSHHTSYQADSDNYVSADLLNILVRGLEVTAQTSIITLDRILAMFQEILPHHNDLHVTRQTTTSEGRANEDTHLDLEITISPINVPVQLTLPLYREGLVGGVIVTEQELRGGET